MRRKESISSGPEIALDRCSSNFEFQKMLAEYYTCHYVITFDTLLSIERYTQSPSSASVLVQLAVRLYDGFVSVSTRNIFSSKIVLYQ